jgi:hypothetical protein
MKSLSEPLLESSAVKVLGATSAAAGKVDKASIDAAARQSDLARMKASGEICGVRRWQQQ